MLITIGHTLWFLVSQIGVAVATALLAIWGLGKYLGKSWLESVFAKDLERFKRAQSEAIEAFKHERVTLLEELKYQQAREMEAHKHRFQRMMDRASKLHQHEFEVLPNAWNLLTKALANTNTVIAIYRELPSIAHMGTGELQSYLDGTSLAEWERGKLSQCSGAERDRELHAMIRSHQRRAAWEAHTAFHNYLITHGIFLREDLREPLRELSNLNYDALREDQLDDDLREMDRKARFADRDRFRLEWLESMNQIQTLVEDRLWEPQKLLAPGED